MTSTDGSTLFTQQQIRFFTPSQKIRLQTIFLLSIYNFYHTMGVGPGSSVGLVTDYGLDGPGSNPGVDEMFCPSRPALESTQLPVKWVPGLSRG